MFSATKNRPIGKAPNVKGALPGLHLPNLCLSLGLGALGGLVAGWLGLPLPWLIGSLTVTAALGILNIRPFDRALGVPMGIRNSFVPVIGVSIGAAVTPDLVGEIARWTPSLIALFLYVPVAHFLAYLVAQRLGAPNRATALYGTMPGGLIEAIAMGEKAGADEALVSVMQFLRLIICIVMIPLGFQLATGEAVGSASGQVIGNVPLSVADWLILIAAGLFGTLLGRALRFPAWIITGSIIASGLVHLLGWVEGGPPRWLIELTQLVIGTSLGSRFAGRSPTLLLTGARLAAGTVSITLLIAFVFAELLAGLVGESWQAVFLAFAPGGIAEMSLVALSLEISVIYVTAHHVARIILAVVVARAAGRWWPGV